MKKVFFTLITLVLISCNNEKPKVEGKSEIIEEKIQVNEPNQFIMDLNLKSSETDVLKMFANNIFINNERTMNISLSGKINKSENLSTMSFSFPKDIKPDVQVYFSLGTKNEKKIYIENINLSFGQTKFSIKANELEDYFAFNQFVNYNSETGEISTKKVNGKHNPLMILRRKIIDQINY